jgi:hypothetical protein
MAPRHVLVMIPAGAGFTKANLSRLSTLAKMMKNAHDLGLNLTELRQETKDIQNRIMRNGGYESPSALQKALTPYLVKYRRLNAALHRNMGVASNFHAARWSKVQNAAGRFKALGRVAAMRPKSPNANANRRHVSAAKAFAIANLMRPYTLKTASPVTTTYNNYMRGPPKPRKRKSPSPARSPPKSVATRSGRRSVSVRR